MKCVAPLGEITFRECSQRHRRLSPSEPNLLLVLRSPAGKEAPASSGDQGRGCSRARTKQGDKKMLAIIAAVLILLWLLGFFAFHVTTAAVHVALVVGLVLLVLHFMKGRTANV